MKHAHPSFVAIFGRTIHRGTAALVLALGLLWAVACQPAPAADAISGPRPAAWAMAIQRPGLSNFFQVSPSLYRGAQPDATGFKELEKLGIRTVINLRHNHDDTPLLQDTSLRNIHIPINTWALDTNDVARFIGAATDTNNWPVFVHCQHGADRTGALVAMYRILVEGWSKPEAIREMTEGGFGHHAVFKNLVTLIENAGLPPAPTNAATKIVPKP